ncbi:MAG: hypothetical protein H7246_06280 [Phycisphaerae bacterium]|nr:hypothetical protein [Saprospiraceae bacterium]
MVLNIFVILIIATILAAGLLGGIANYYMEQANGAGFKKSVLLGLTASATVPLLLNTMSSSLTEKCLNGEPSAYFIFFGFCTVAAIFSSKFLQTLGDKLLQDLKEVKQKQEELAETTDVLVAQNSDPAEMPPVSPPGASDGKEFESFKIGDATKSPNVVAPNDEQKVLAAFQSSKFPFRTVEGIAKDAGMDISTAQSKLLEMEIQGKVKKTKRIRDGIQVWSLR